ncbi:MAG: T9SS C-terminal target domain-containing protein [Bacteroidetes bacterium]|nr:T9SS C-terminal target domain-containing protein [Bacteroidota bacterium]
MKNIFRFLFLSLSLMLLFDVTYAREKTYSGKKDAEIIKQTAAGCAPGSNYKYLDINNVRTLLYSYGNGWFLEKAEYEIPKGSKKTSMFSFALWIGGIDLNNNLKLCAYAYGQGPTGGAAHTKNDFWPGPLKIDGTAGVDEVTCAKYDKLYQITKADVQEFLAYLDNPSAFPGYSPPKSITDYPAKGDRANGYAYYMAPFYDADHNGVYEYSKGDYPFYDFTNSLCPRLLKPGQKISRAKIANGGADDTLGILADQVLKGDQTLWSVYNDKGNVHSETQGEPIGMEIRAQYFAFATNDAINDMTFYSYEIINRSTYTLTGTYFSQWVDPDLGYAYDDYVGCDVGRGLGYCYNGNPVDGTGQIEAYGTHPPAVGVDFFQGPYLDPDNCDNPSFKGNVLKGPTFNGDCSIVGLDGATIRMYYGPSGSDSGDFIVRAEAINGINFGDSIVDNERYGMKRYVYYNNDGSIRGNPSYAPDYYNYLRGIWRDGQRMHYGGNGHPAFGGTGPVCDFMFPEMSDICNWGTRGEEPAPKLWTEVTAANPAGDRRFMQSAGPFTLRPGACNYITVGIPWARAAGTPWESVQLLKIVDDKCQKLFDNCFTVLEGPRAPDLTFQELDKKLILYITNHQANNNGNNYLEKYQEYDPNIPNPDNLPHSDRNDSIYRFEGYQIYQLKNADVTDLNDPSLARLVAQCDIQNGVSKLVNWTYDTDLGGNVGKIMVTGDDKGIKHTFVIDQDLFADEFHLSNTNMINHRQYYYTAVAYAYNQYKPYQPDSLDKGQMTPYLQGRGNIQTYTAIPHIPIGDIMNSDIGDGPVITRIQGQGNGGMTIELSEKSIAEILAKPMADSVINIYGNSDYPISYHPEYKVSAGPLNVKVVDPLNIMAGNYIVRFDSMVPSLNSSLVNAKILYGKWRLYDLSSGLDYPSDTSTIYPYEQLSFKTMDQDSVIVNLDLGLAFTINQVPFAGDSARDGSRYSGNALLAAPAAIYEDSSKIWLAGVPDNDVPASPQNWIRAGIYKGPDINLYDWDMGTLSTGNPWDPDKNYAKIQGGTWAPYCLTVANDQSPIGTPNISPAITKASKTKSTMDRIASVDIVITPDTTKWTRCPVIEMCPDAKLSEGGAPKFEIRRHKSVNVNGDTGVVNPGNPKLNSSYINATGMGWFPGYAINLESGERLNIMFGENSWLSADNGRDMLWNPSDRLYDAGGEPVFGGMHYVYIMGSMRQKVTQGPQTYNLDYPAYDGGAYFITHVKKVPSQVWQAYGYGSCMYVGMPLSIDGQQWLSNEVKIKIRVAKPYARYFAGTLPQTYSDTAENKCWPEYTFSTATIATSKENADKLSSDLDLINVVPNPYYGYDDYERNQLDNRVKIVNLPLKSTVTIFNMSGTMIRQYDVDKSGITEPRGSLDKINTDALTSIDWDLKNFAGIPISGGVYLIHVKVDGVGERTLKWFGILRPVDLNSY